MWPWLRKTWKDLDGPDAGLLGQTLLVSLCIVLLSMWIEAALHALQALWAWYQGASTLFLR